MGHRQPLSPELDSEMAPTRPASMGTCVMSHAIHRRAQRGLCLRLLDVPSPGLSGPSADES
jgi:uncharacterized damage-inducible protein DinB